MLCLASAASQWLCGASSLSTDGVWASTLQAGLLSPSFVGDRRLWKGEGGRGMRPFSQRGAGGTPENLRPESTQDSSFPAPDQRASPQIRLLRLVPLFPSFLWLSSARLSRPFTCTPVPCPRGSPHMGLPHTPQWLSLVTPSSGQPVPSSAGDTWAAPPGSSPMVLALIQVSLSE